MACFVVNHSSTYFLVNTWNISYSGNWCQYFHTFFTMKFHLNMRSSWDLIKISLRSYFFVEILTTDTTVVCVRVIRVETCLTVFTGHQEFISTFLVLIDRVVFTLTDSTRAGLICSTMSHSGIAQSNTISRFRSFIV